MAVAYRAPVSSPLTSAIPGSVHGTRVRNETSSDTCGETATAPARPPARPNARPHCANRRPLPVGDDPATRMKPRAVRRDAEGTSATSRERSGDRQHRAVPGDCQQDSRQDRSCYPPAPGRSRGDLQQDPSCYPPPCRAGGLPPARSSHRACAGRGHSCRPTRAGYGEVGSVAGLGSLGLPTRHKALLRVPGSPSTE
jgi:hypothetical protein